MVTVKFLHLLRSKYGIKELSLKPGKFSYILEQIKELHPEIDFKDFDSGVIFINGVQIIYQTKSNEILKDGDELVFTHFVGGG